MVVYTVYLPNSSSRGNIFHPTIITSLYDTIEPYAKISDIDFFSTYCCPHHLCYACSFAYRKLHESVPPTALEALEVLKYLLNYVIIAMAVSVTFSIKRCACCSSIVSDDDHNFFDDDDDGMFG